jgi:hypothetical protein
MFTLLYFELLCMQASQVLQILRSLNFNLLLIMLDTAAAFDIPSALFQNLLFKQVNLVLILFKLGFSFHPVRVLLCLDIVLEFLDLSL